jgi:signal transduction histidine kinase
VRLLVSGTAFVVGGAFGTLISSQPQMINSPWAPVLLANIRDRVEALHGRLTIESRLGAGTSVRAELPLSTSARGQ